MTGRPSIYGLFDKDGNLRYIGKANNPAARLVSHMRDARTRKTPVYNWIRKNGVPEMRVLEADCVDWREAEKRLIAEARSNGDNLLNVADGGDEPYCSPETRSANGRKLQSHPATIAQRKINGRKLVDRINNDPEFALRREIKRTLSSAIRDGYLSNARRARLREGAKRNPYLLGGFADIPDREEDAQGRAWVQSGMRRVQVG